MAQRQRSDNRLMTVVETREFQQRAATRMADVGRQEFITFIAGHPEDGVMMVGTGGVRKSRWGVGSPWEKWCAGCLLLPQPDHADLSLDRLCQKRTGQPVAA